MQLKEKLNLTFLHSKKQTLFKVVFSLLGFLVVLAVGFVIFYLCELLHLFSSANIIPLGVIALLLFVIFCLNTVSCTIGLSKSLFYAKDNQVLVTFPVNANQIYMSKMLVYYISEIRKAFGMIIPILFAYGILSKLSIMFFVWMPVMIVVASLIPVLIGGILAIPMMFVIAFFKKFQIIKFVILTAALVGIVIGVIKLINLIPEDIDLLSSWIVVSEVLRGILTWVSVNLAPFYIFATFICGRIQIREKMLFTNYSWQCLLIILAIIAVMTVANFLISRPIYLKLISKQFEFKRKEIKFQKRNLPKSKFFATSIYETKRTIRDVSNLSNSLLTLIVAPITILLLNRVYAAINTKLMGDYLTIIFNVLIILLFALAHNIKVSSIYSKDGDALIIGKTKPTTPFLVMFPRLMYNFIVTAAIIILSMISFTYLSPIDRVEGTYLTIGLIFVAYAHIIWSADIDFTKPQVALFRTEGNDANNPNETKSTLLTFFLATAFTAITFLLLFKNANYVYIKLCFVGIAFFLLRLSLFSKKVRLLYKEM